MNLLEQFAEDCLYQGSWAVNVRLNGQVQGQGFQYSTLEKLYVISTTAAAAPLSDPAAYILLRDLVKGLLAPGGTEVILLIPVHAHELRRLLIHFHLAHRIDRHLDLASGLNLPYKYLLFFSTYYASILCLRLAGGTYLLSTREAYHRN
jgi:hypothetical protein